MEIIGWILIIACFIVSFIGLIYPIIPSVLFILFGFILYGVFFTFEELTWWFWTIEIIFIALLFAADTISSMIGVKKFGGSKAGMWGSTIGLIFGPFLLPFAGIILGPFIGAVLGEILIEKQKIQNAIKSGIGSVIGFLTSVVTKGIIQLILIIMFFITIF